MPSQRFAAPSEVPGLAARRIAADILDGVLHKHRTLDDQLDGAAVHPGLKTLADRDRALMRRLVATILRRLGTLGHVLSRLLDRGVPTDAPRAQSALLIGAAQILWMDVPDHAAVDLSVRLVQSDRRAAKYDEPSLDITVKSDPAQWASRLHGEMLATGTVRTLLQGSVAMLPGFAEGQWWVQDAAAALPARLFGDVAGKTIVDLCAAPGGKTAQLAHAGARVIAVDRSPARMARLRDNLARLALSADAVVADAVEWQGAEHGAFDGVLLDAPAWLRQEADIAALASLQKRLLQKAASLLKPGGMLIYCTCSLEPEEGGEPIAAVLANEPSLRRLPIEASEVAGLSEIVTAEGDLRTLPCHLPHLGRDPSLYPSPDPNPDPRLGGLDGFYVARLIKR